MPSEVLPISYFTYYTASVLWGLYLRRFLFPVFCLVVVWHFFFYGLIVGAMDDAKDNLSSAQYRYWLPLTSIGGIAIGYLTSEIWQFKRLLFIRKFDDYDCWIPVTLINFIAFHAVLGIWDTTGTFDPPINYWVTFAIQVVLLIFWYFINRRFDIWGYIKQLPNGNEVLSFDDNNLQKFTLAHALLTISTTVLFAIIEGAAPDFWPFWIALITFGFHAVLLMISTSVARRRSGHVGFMSSAVETYTMARAAVANSIGMDATDVFTATKHNSSSASSGNTRRVSEHSASPSSSSAQSMELLSLTDPTKGE